ncbi:MAG: aminotransferase class IV [Acidimicrobiales bacterium]
MSGPMATVWFDGQLVDRELAHVAPTEHGLTVGDGVFETLKVVDGTPFALRRHLRRLHRSADGMGLAAPETRLLAKAARAVCEANPGATKLRIMVTSGDGPAGSGRGDGPSTLVIFADDTPLATAPIVLATVPWARNERSAVTGIKTTSYAENVLALQWAHREEADEAVFANTVDQLCEGSGTNIFVVLDDRLMTPPLSSGCLAGITRELLLEVTDAVEAPIPMSELDRCTEIFVTSSTRDVAAVASIDGRQLPAPPGPHTRAATVAFATLAADLDP